jgi:hypothetical protein
VSAPSEMSVHVTGCACSARRSRASRTSWSRSAPAGRPR